MEDRSTATTTALLYLNGINVSFDGFRALNNLSLSVEPGEMRAIIGPNGAGKTTMMDVVTGKTRPDDGDVFFEGGAHDLSKLDETEIATLGIGRKFQKPTVFEQHSVFENLELAMKSDKRVRASLLARLDSAQSDRIAATLRRIGLQAEADRAAGLLSHGQKQWLEIGMLLMQEPQLLLLDEPVAGMTDAETERTAELMIREDGGARLALRKPVHAAPPPLAHEARSRQLASPARTEPSVKCLSTGCRAPGPVRQWPSSPNSPA